MPGVDLAERHDRVARERLRRGDEQGGDGGDGEAEAHSAAQRSDAIASARDDGRMPRSRSDWGARIRTGT